MILDQDGKPFAYGDPSVSLAMRQRMKELKADMEAALCIGWPESRARSVRQIAHEIAPDSVPSPAYPMASIDSWIGGN